MQLQLFKPFFENLSIFFKTFLILVNNGEITYLYIFFCVHLYIKIQILTQTTQELSASSNGPVGNKRTLVFFSPSKSEKTTEITK